MGEGCKGKRNIKNQRKNLAEAGAERWEWELCKKKYYQPEVGSVCVCTCSCSPPRPPPLPEIPGA